MSKELEFVHSKGFTVMSHSADGKWFNLVKQKDDYLIGMELNLNDKTYQLRYTIDMATTVYYMEFGTHLLKDAAFDHAVEKLESIAEHLKTWQTI